MQYGDSEQPRSTHSARSGSQQGRSISKASEAEEDTIKPVTTIKPFNLTKPKPKMIPVPDVIKREVKAAPVPRHLNKKSLADVEREKEERRLATVNAVRSQYESGPKKKFDLATGALKSTQKNDFSREEVERCIQKELKFEGTKPRAMPNFEKHRAEVKITAAALKREKHQIELEEREESKRLADMEMGLKDASEFIRWQREMEQKDDIEKIEYVQKKKIEMELSRQHAIFAKEQAESENHELAINIKKEMGKHLEKRDKELQEVLGKNK